MKLVVLDANAFWTEQLFRQCAEFSDVLLLKPRAFRAHRASTGSLFSDSSARELGPRLWERRLSMPPRWMFNLWPLSHRRLARAIRSFAGNQPLTLVLTYPQYRSLIPALKPTRAVYYNFDDYRDNWTGCGAVVPQWESELVELAGVTICIADHRTRVLRNQHPVKASNIFHLPLGCTPEFMVDDNKRPEPSVFAGMGRPLMGYVGALNYRFDFAFLAELAARLPDINFALGGHVKEDGDAAWLAGLRRAQSLPNVKFLGWVEHAQLGNHLNAFDALFMCYSDCNFNRNACPAKLWDYLGTGKPIVANANNPETLLWSDAVQVGATPEEFASAVRKAVAETSSELRNRRLEIAQAHTWEKLGKRLQGILTSAES